MTGTIPDPLWASEHGRRMRQKRRTPPQKRLKACPVREVVYGENNFKERVDIGPMTNWQRISATEYRLDDVWTVKKEHTFWRAYRGKSPTLQGFFERKNAMKEAERLRKEDEHYR